jgi:hypothetical protein
MSKTLSLRPKHLPYLQKSIGRLIRGKGGRYFLPNLPALCLNLYHRGYLPVTPGTLASGYTRFCPHHGFLPLFPWLNCLPSSGPSQSNKGKGSAFAVAPADMIQIKDMIQVPAYMPRRRRPHAPLRTPWPRYNAGFPSRRKRRCATQAQNAQERLAPRPGALFMCNPPHRI